MKPEDVFTSLLGRLMRRGQLTSYHLRNAAVKQKRVIVVAGRLHEAKAWADANGYGMADYIYAVCASHIRGCEGHPFVKVGTWDQRPDAKEIHRDLAIMRCYPWVR